MKIEVCESAQLQTKISTQRTEAKVFQYYSTRTTLSIDTLKENPKAVATETNETEYRDKKMLIARHGKFGLSGLQSKK